MNKRQKFVFSSVLMSLGLLSTQFVTIEFPWRYIAILVLFVVSFLVSAWALFDDLKGVEWMMIVPYPGLFAVSVAFFYFLLPTGFVSRLIILSLFSLGMYAYYLTSNIFSVAAIRTIQLLRAAHAVGFLLLLLTSLLFYNTIFSFKLPFFANAILVFLVSFPIVLNGLWSVKLQPKITREVLLYSSILSFLLAEMAVAISFWPATVWIASLFLVTALYVFLGLLQQHLQQRLFAKTIQEYSTVGLFVLSVMILLTPWRG